MGPSQLGAEKQEKCRPCVDKDVRNGRWGEGPPGIRSSDVVAERYEASPHSVVSKKKKKQKCKQPRGSFTENWLNTLQYIPRVGAAYPQSPQKEATTKQGPWMGPCGSPTVGHQGKPGPPPAQPEGRGRRLVPGHLLSHIP